MFRTQTHTPALRDVNPTRERWTVSPRRSEPHTAPTTPRTRGKLSAVSPCSPLRAPAPLTCRYLTPDLQAGREEHGESQQPPQPIHCSVWGSIVFPKFSTGEVRLWFPGSGVLSLGGGFGGFIRAAGPRAPCCPPPCLVSSFSRVSRSLLRITERGARGARGAPSSAAAAE